MLAISDRERPCSARISPSSLGLVMVINLAFGLTTPPVGTALFVALKVANLPMDKIIAPLLPLLACMCVVLVLVTYVPDIYVWLPRSFGLVK